MNKPTGKIPVHTMACAGLAGLLCAIAAPALAQWWNPMSTIPPGRLGQPGYSIEYTPQLEEDAVAAIGRALQSGDFAKLDRMHDEFLEMHRAGAAGRNMLAVFPSALRRGFEGDRASYEKLFAEWRRAAPGSALRPAAEGAFWWRLAWKARGGGFASEVPKEAWKTFEDDLKRASEVLEEGRAAGKASPIWYWAVLSVGGSIGAPPRSLDHFFDEGATGFPAFMPLYSTRLNFLGPQWGGDYDRVDAFIRSAVRRTQAKEGTTLYATLYSQVAQGFQGDDFFRETHASWRLMQHAFEEQAARGTVDLNRYATYACIAGDRATTAQLLEQLGDKANLGDRLPGFPTEACIALAREGR